ncbi:hypothetical protein DASC09_058100 [Saccharomycopsis crataegensis]|uniref:Alanine--tRNA ligase n=1 Tax=Saccharomycopsis crataegensis TaxID=43959 RepID=A0AAV5QUU2_9ASCO|nr:hypothetical protein DASC09_058100 [Saccharomycopsis crataegensis]
MPTQLTPLTKIKKWDANSVRDTYINYFKANGHRFVPSSPVIPFEDPTLLFTNAGMNQYKPIFLGIIDPSSDFYGLERAVNSQKCIRAGGKHNDLEDVGKDSYHHTFFEMLGNWSFGDYFKEKAIFYAWDLLTREYGLDPGRMYVTYFEGDEKLGLEPDLESRDIWLKIGLPKDHILPGDAKDNFWEMGDKGPCGPCSELHYDRIGGGRDAAHLVNKDDPNVLEIWNIVFIQFNRISPTELKTLPSKHIDTGMGFERLVSILQDVKSNYDTDIFLPLFEAIQEIANVRYYGRKFGKDDVDMIDTSYRVLADHVRTLSFAIAEGGIPNNEGRGYVLRRILRRGARYARKYLKFPIGEKPFFSLLFTTLAKQVEVIFPELQKNADFIKKVMDEEELSFAKTLDKGEKLFESHVKNCIATGYKMLDGKELWKLYDTFGFPVDLTQLMADEAGLTIDQESFEQAKKLSYEASKLKAGSQKTSEIVILNVHALDKLQKKLNITKTNDSFKYTTNNINATVLAIYYDGSFVNEADSGSNNLGIILDKTPFYAESGGQECDTGIFFSENCEFQVTNVQRYGGYILHTGVLRKGLISVKDEGIASFDNSRRIPINKNHTGTHVLNLALRKTLGETYQRGSSVSKEKLRFDFSHDRSLSLEEISNIEGRCNEEIDKNLFVYYADIELPVAKKITGIRSVFGETYPNPVRVVSIGIPVEDLASDPENPDWINYSIECCGGTHVTSTIIIKKMVITEQVGIAKGIRRITAASGNKAIEIQMLSQHFSERIEFLTHMKFGDAKKKELKQFKAELSTSSLSILDKYELTKRFNEIDKEFKYEVKKVQKKDSDQVLSFIKDYFSNSKKQYLVKYLNGITSSNLKIINDSLNYMEHHQPSKSICLIVGDEANKTLVHGSYICNEATNKGLKALDVSSLVSAHVGGKSGGKGNVCQGTGMHFEYIDEAVDEVTKLFREIL